MCQLINVTGQYFEEKMGSSERDIINAHNDKSK